MKTGNGIIQVGNGIISPTFRAPIKNFFYKMFQTFDNESKIGFKNRKGKYLLLSELQSKNFSYKMFLTITSKSKTYFQNRKWDYQDRKWNYFSYFQISNN